MSTKYWHVHVKDEQLDRLHHFCSDLLRLLLQHLSEVVDSLLPLREYFQSVFDSHLCELDL